VKFAYLSDHYPATRTIIAKSRGRGRHVRRRKFSSSIFGRANPDAPRATTRRLLIRLFANSITTLDDLFPPPARGRANGRFSGESRGSRKRLINARREILITASLADRGASNDPVYPLPDWCRGIRRNCSVWSPLMRSSNGKLVPFAEACSNARDLQRSARRLFGDYAFRERPRAVMLGK